MPKKNSTPKVYSNLLTTFKSILNESEIDNIARDTGFLKRKRVLSPHKFVCCLLSTLGITDLQWLAQLHRTYCSESKVKMGYKPFHDQLRKKGLPLLLQSLLLRFMNSFISSDIAPRNAHKLLFDDILIHDGSSFALKDTLKEAVPGRFSKTSPAAVEVHTTLSVFGKSPHFITIAPDKDAEKHFRPSAESLTGKLLLIDRGYEDKKYYQEIQDHNGFYVARGKISIKPVIVTAYCQNGKRQRKLEAKPLDLSKLKGKHYDMEIEWRVSKTVVLKERLCVFYKRDHSKKETKNNDFTLIHTNLEKKLYSLSGISKLYRYRWQVELFFKECKSYSNLHKRRITDVLQQ